MHKIRFQSKYLIFTLVLITLFVIPLTVFIQQQQQQTQSDASQTVTTQQVVAENCILPPNTLPGEVFEAVLTADQVVPPTESPSLGRARVVLPTEDSVTQLSYVSFCYNGLLSINSGVHIHFPAPPGEEASKKIILPVSDHPEGDIYTFPMLLREEDVKHLRNGLWYIQIETILEYKDGEIRGQFGDGTNQSPSTAFALTVFMHGIGNSGDNANPTAHSMSNKNPTHNEREVKLQLYDETDTLIEEQIGTLTYDQSSGNFKSTISLEKNISSGNYIIRITSPYYLTRRIGGFQTITAGKENILPPITLIAGDANKDNTLNILDYNLIIGCYSDFAPAASCTSNKKPATDLTDDTTTNQFDYNLFLRNISVQKGD